MNKLTFGIIVGAIIILTAIFIIIPLTEKEYVVKDRCGPIANFISHTVKDESACQSQCIARCNVEDLEMKKVAFSLVERGCNECTCICR